MKLRKGEFMQKGNTVIIIEEFMQGVLGLSGTEIMVYAVMYSFCKLGSMSLIISLIPSPTQHIKPPTKNAAKMLLNMGDFGAVFLTYS